MTHRPETLHAAQVMDAVHQQDLTARAVAPNAPICVLAQAHHPAA